MKKILLISIIVLIFMLSITSVFAKAYILDWNLVDSGKHLDCDGDSKYMSRIKKGVSKWENYKT